MVQGDFGGPGLPSTHFLASAPQTMVPGNQLAKQPCSLWLTGTAGPWKRRSNKVSWDVCWKTSGCVCLVVLGPSAHHCLLHCKEMPLQLLQALLQWARSMGKSDAHHEGSEYPHRMPRSGFAVVVLSLHRWPVGCEPREDFARLRQQMGKRTEAPSPLEARSIALFTGCLENQGRKLPYRLPTQGPHLWIQRQETAPGHSFRSAGALDLLHWGRGPGSQKKGNNHI